MAGVVRMLVVIAIAAGALFAGVVFLAQSDPPQVQPVQKVIENDAFPK
ncbi:hypothetical protein [Tepidicaulis sp.]|jgi:hypothetical protein